MTENKDKDGVMLARHDEQIKHIVKKQEKNESDLEEIKDSISSLDKNVALFAQSMTKVITDNQRQDERFKEQYLDITRKSEERADATQQIYAEIQEMKAIQDVMYTAMTDRDTMQDAEIKSLRVDISRYKEEVHIETQRLEETLNNYTNRTKFDWFEMLNNGILTIVSEGFKYAGIALVVYGGMKAIEKFK